MAVCFSTEEIYVIDKRRHFLDFGGAPIRSSFAQIPDVRKDLGIYRWVAALRLNDAVQLFNGWDAPTMAELLCVLFCFPQVHELHRADTLAAFLPSGADTTTAPGQFRPFIECIPFIEHEARRGRARRFVLVASAKNTA